MEREDLNLSAESFPAENRSNRMAAVAALQAQLAQRTLQRASEAEAQPGSRVLPGAPPAIAGEQYLIFSLLDREFALKADHIQGIERLADVTPLPNVAPWVRGVINLRGSIASVVDLRAFLDVEQLPYNPRTRLLSIQDNEMVIGIVVDAVSDMIAIPPTALIAVGTRQSNIPTWATPYAAGSAMVGIGNRLVVLLDATRLLFSEKMQHYSLEP